MVELILTGAAIACAIGMQVVARVLKRDPATVWDLVVIVLGLGILIWTPSWLRSLLIGAFGVAAVWQLGIRYVIAMIALVVPIAIWLSGGVSVVLFAILAVIGVQQVRDARRHLIRLSRARQLVVGEPVEHEVELTGAAHAVHPTVDPVDGGPCAMWELVVRGDTLRRSESLVEIRGRDGAALVDPMVVTTQWSVPKKSLVEEEAKRASLALGLTVEVGCTMAVIREGTECYVVGYPTWTTSPNAGTYRDGPMLPLFGAGKGAPLIVDGSEVRLRSDFWWGLLSWGSWGALCAAIAILQLGGWS